MRKVDLRMNEQEKYELIKNLVEKNGNKRKVSINLNCSLRNVNRLIQKYSLKGKQGFVHGNRERKPSKTISKEIKTEIINLYKSEQYNNANFSHFRELLLENKNIKVSSNFIYNLLSKNGILSPKCQRITKKRKVKAEKEQQKMLTNPTTQILTTPTREIPNSLAHPRKPRKKYFGEQIQMDASDHLWINKEKWHLHIGIDDSTSKIVGAYFTLEETLIGYYNVLNQILTNYGIPHEIKTDNRMIFTNNKEKSLSQEKDSHTQFGYACKQFGILLTTTSVPQQKGRVERCFGTLQSRLITELKIANIKTIEAANEFLETYIAKHNEGFALHANLNTSAFAPQPEPEVINQTLAILSSRKTDNGCGINYQNKYYQPYKDNKVVTFRSKTKCLVIKCFDKKLLVSIEEGIYELKELKKHQIVSKDFDLNVPKSEQENKKYVPPMTHPWKAKSWESYLKSQQKSYKNSGNV